MICICLKLNPITKFEFGVAEQLVAYICNISSMWGLFLQRDILKCVDDKSACSYCSYSGGKYCCPCMPLTVAQGKGNFPKYDGFRFFKKLSMCHFPFLVSLDDIKDDVISFLGSSPSPLQVVKNQHVFSPRCVVDTLVFLWVSHKEILWPTLT